MLHLLIEFKQPLLNRKNQDLSSGERRIVEILLLLNSKVEFILLDEHFNGLSPIVKDYLTECIKKMKPSKGIIITDHDYESVLSLSDSIVYLKDGYLNNINHWDELLQLGYFTEAQSID